MNWNRIQGNWQHAAGKAREQWNRLTEDDVDPDAAANRRVRLMGRIQECYGMLTGTADRQLADWRRRLTGMRQDKDSDRG